MKTKKIIVSFEDGANVEGIRKSSKKIFEEILGDKILVESKIKGDIKCEKLKNLNSVVDINNKVYKETISTLNQGFFPLIIGGDHSISIGSVFAVNDVYDNLGVIWIDAHADMNTNITTLTGNIHGMSLSILQGYGTSKLTNISEKKIKTENIVIFGTRDLDYQEEQLMKKVKVKYYTNEYIKNKGFDITLNEAINYLKEKVEMLHISFDLDVIDPIISPGVSVPVENGISREESIEIISKLFDEFNVTSMDIVEYNQKYDKNDMTIKLIKEITDLFD